MRIDRCIAVAVEEKLWTRTWRRIFTLPLLHLDRSSFDEDIKRGRMLRLYPSSILMEDFACLSVPPYYAGTGFPERPRRLETLPNKTLYSEKSRESIRSLQIIFAIYNRGWTSAYLFETLSAQRSPVILMRLAPPARASKKLEARRISSFEDTHKLHNSHRTCTQFH